MIYTGKKVYDPLTDTYSTGYWIIDLANAYDYQQAFNHGLMRAVQIIDKYRKEQEDNGFFDEIMDDESDGEVYEKIKEIIDKVKEQEE